MDRRKLIFGKFWLFGLLNNVLYVVILAAAVDIVGPTLPKSLILLADILPSFLVKLVAPFFIDRVEYHYRIWSLIALSGFGMLLVASGRLGVCIVGIVLASISSGVGEITFLQLTHYFSHVALNGWSSGTGGAGLAGSFLYMLLTSILKIPVSRSLLLFSILPIGFLLYFTLQVERTAYEPLASGHFMEAEDNSGSVISLEAPRTTVDNARDCASRPRLAALRERIEVTMRRLKVLVVPYMIPLSTVYLFEYLINQGVSPTLMFPIHEGYGTSQLFHKYRDIYVAYGTLYQLGVFISRSSGSWVRIRGLYLLSVLQFLNLVILLIQSWYYVIHSVWVIMAIVLYEGLLGGASYVNSFLNISEDVPLAEREFSLGAVSISDSSGTLVAAFIGILLEPVLCSHQVKTGRPWCQLE
ncbi:AEL171Cp [Eremothecium gossypii ATCC 10895]|uniref:Protein BTN1 n=1 Tax=Eremothecium gossypii (strain ATCC 10895 / CBS 109.51 / FGSC 9923 / NRRL Y-1056) TaxID=284811 RepID=BTN1_EREGS|nr:AEL171Cp [Eremothecium gossypii ATCC 10895]Q758C3.1 RecName: Full=Protein BTN1; Flags: Precursor [Eremothecium gossypii ATCC 10895]AAS52514.1 AEL171Cp [Eremothecium gossypii ATCC 10895]AEY96814.1 FAEL171Cp [Eremothecium gossypii FDAG1]